MLQWAYIPYILALAVSGAIALALGIYAARNRELRGAHAFMWFCLAAALWVFTYAVELSSEGEPAKVFWSKIQYIGITAGPIIWLAFALSYTRRDNRLSRHHWALLLICPLITLSLAFTNEAHGLIWRTTGVVPVGAYSTLRVEYGSWFWVHTAFSYSCVLAGSVLLVTGLVESRQFYRRQRLALMVGILAPWVGNILYIAKVSPVPGLDLTPFAAVVTAVAFALALFSFRLLDLVPVARRAMLDSMSDGVIALDTRNRILDLNQAASRIIRIDHKSSIGRLAAEVLHRHSDLVERFADVREVHTEIVRDTANGPRYFELQIVPLRDVVGEYAGRLVTLHDITERKAAQEEIQALNTDLEARVLARTAELAAANKAKEETLRREQAARQDLEFLAEASRILAGSLDEETTLTNLAHHIVPYLADACVIHAVEDGGTFRRVAGTHKDPEVARLMAGIGESYPLAEGTPYGFPNVVRSGQPDFLPHFETEYLSVMARDEQHMAMLRALDIRSYMCVPLVGRERTLGAITLLRCHPGQEYTRTSLALATDLAQRAALALDNAQLYRAAQQAVQARDEFLTVASHELKTPLTSLILALHMLLRHTRRGVDGINGVSPQGEPSQDDHGSSPADYLTRKLSIVQEQSKRLDHLVSNLLDISRITSGRLQLEPQPVDLAALVRQTVSQLQDALAEARCTLTLQADTPVRGYWDPDRIEQVIVNLLTNAMKYGRGHPITVTASADGSTACLVVSDRGIGIAAEHLERIFDRFERAVVPGVSGAAAGGMGLGLYITRQIVEAHGGSIGVFSAPGEGATFTVHLPVAPD